MDILGAHPHPAHCLEIVPEKNAIKIEVVRDLIQKISLKLSQGERFIIIIEEADALTENAANALLKTLEEPPATVLFLLLSTLPETLPSTIRSRCHKIHLPFSAKHMQQELAQLESVWKEPILSLLQAPASFTKASKLAETVAGQTEKMFSLFPFLEAVWHDLTLLHMTDEESLLLLPQLKETLKKFGENRNPQTLFEGFDTIRTTFAAIEGNVNKTLALEHLFVKLTGA